MKTISLDSFCDYWSLSCPEFSPKGGHFCFVRARADKKNNGYRSEICELRDGKVLQLTSGGKEGFFLFQDEDTILFPADREKHDEPCTGSSFYRLSLNGGEAVKAFSFPLEVEQLFPLNGEDYIVAAKTVPGFEDLYLAQPNRVKEYRQYLKDCEDYEVIDQQPWWWNGSGFTRSMYTSLYLFHSKTGKTEMLTAKNLSVMNPKLSPDRKEVWFLGSEIRQRLSSYEMSDLYRLRLSDRSVECLVHGSKEFSVQEYDFGETFAVIAASDGKYGMNTDPDFYRLNYADGSVKLWKKYGLSIGSSVGSDVRHGGGKALRMQSDTLYFISTVYDTAELFRLQGEELTQLTRFNGSVDSFAVSGEHIVTVALKDMKPQELYTEKGRALTRLNRAALAGRYVAQPEELIFERDGQELHGFVLKPKDFVPGTKYPVIFDIHGGPKTVYGPVFYHEMQYWANLGYFVIFCNPTGSDGRGEFMNICGRYGSEDYEDLMAFCDAALAAWPEMDREELFETGGSYGGFMTNWIIGHTDRFRACASQRSISNWFSFYGVSDIGPDFAVDQTEGEPWTAPEKLWEQSPLKYADRCTTPTLFIHSFEDYRCPIDQGYQMYTALVTHGVETKMVLFKGENHELSRSGKPLHRIRRLDEITKWFETHR